MNKIKERLPALFTPVRCKTFDGYEFTGRLIPRILISNLKFSGDPYTDYLIADLSSDYVNYTLDAVESWLPITEEESNEVD